jgi:large subunit ribosomal protein L25
MSHIRISATSRDAFGKGASRRLRRDGLVPGVIYGRGNEVRHIALPGHELLMALRTARVVLEIEQDGSVTLVAPVEIQRDAVRRDLEHIDLVVITEAEARARAGQAIAEAKAAEEAAIAAIEAAAIAERAAAAEDAEAAANAEAEGGTADSAKGGDESAASE